MEAAYDPGRRFPQEQFIHLLACSNLYERCVVEVLAEVGNEPFHRMWPVTEMMRVGQDHQFHLACAQELG
jgi:hypothetical protein